MPRRDIDELEHAEDITMSPRVNIVAFKERNQFCEIRKREFRMIFDAAVDRLRSTLDRAVFIGEKYLHQLFESQRIGPDVFDDLHRLPLRMLSR